ncbi:MAG: hypothetical protein IT385_24335 [Deltaproteobacteria bacterium]|nr:hypothetical protein [Deltaproteobacteria bacterium]
MKSTGWPTLVLAVGASLLFVGCAGGAAGLLTSGLALVALLGFAACIDDKDEGDATTDATITTDTTTSTDTTVVTDTTTSTTTDTVTTTDATLEDADANTCDGQWQHDCVNGQRVPVCCPTGVACNYGWGVEWCEGDRCVVMPDTCAGSDADVSDTSEPETVEPIDTTDEADATCDGTWEAACREGKVVQLCCPAGLACNYGQTMVDCGDGTCVEMPATCPQ